MASFIAQTVYFVILAGVSAILHFATKTLFFISTENFETLNEHFSNETVVCVILTRFDLQSGHSYT